MTYPRVEVRGHDLPKPFSGWDDREKKDRLSAVYYPSMFKLKEGAGFLYLEWSNDETTQQRWISFDCIDSFDATYD